MRRIPGVIISAGLWLGLAAGAVAQDSLNAFGSFPTNTGAGLPYTTYAPRTNYGMAATYNAYSPNSYYGAARVAPGITMYNSGYSGQASGYLPGTYAASYGYAPYAYRAYGYPYYGYRSYSYPTYGYRRGLFGLRNR
ncbi:MAG: hypothetical protein P4L84_18025 [Isosphaeraceae bacterium]|nr:hypothetical protein [Isosphaeraceae bacterium]